MNIFLIPSWFPGEVYPLAGSFIAEQVEAMADLADVNIVVSLWGQGDLYIDFARFFDLAVFFRRFRASRRFSRRNGKFYEAYSPALYWSHRLPFGGEKRLRDVNLENFNVARKELGSIDLIHAHVGYPAGCLAEYLSRKTGVPYVLTEHMGPFPFPALVRRGRLLPELSSAYKNASRVIAVSPAQAALMEGYGVSRLSVIPNFVDERNFDCAPPQSEKFIFLTVCSVVTSKGIGDLLEAISLWHPSVDSVEFRVVGDGPDLEKFMMLAEELGVSSLINWCGSVDRSRIPIFFKACHAFVLPSHHESFGVVYAEAIACGKPVIATKCGGPEFIVNDVNGVLIDVGDVGALAQALRYIKDNWVKYSALDIRSDFLKRFSRKTVSRTLEQLYLEVTKKNASSDGKP